MYGDDGVGKGMTKNWLKRKRELGVEFFNNLENPEMGGSGLNPLHGGSPKGGIIQYFSLQGVEEKLDPQNNREIGSPPTPPLEDGWSGADHPPGP